MPSWNQLLRSEPPGLLVLNQITGCFLLPAGAKTLLSPTPSLSCLPCVCRTVAAEVRKQIAGQYGGSPQLFKNLNAGAATSNTVRVLRRPCVSALGDFIITAPLWNSAFAPAVKYTCLNDLMFLYYCF